MRDLEPVVLLLIETHGGEAVPQLEQAVDRLIGEGDLDEAAIWATVADRVDGRQRNLK